MVYMSLVLFVLYWTAFNAIYALLSSHMTNKDDDNDDDEMVQYGVFLYNN